MTLRRFVFLCCLAATAAPGLALANNITLSAVFPDAPPLMAAAPLSCAGPPQQAYHLAGAVTVSATGLYQVADAGNLPGFTGTGTGVLDIVLSIYEDSFEPATPDLNRIGVIDEGQEIALETGHDYILVVQPFCGDALGVYALVIRGDGQVSGAGFGSAAHTFGQHSASDLVASFPNGIGQHRYDVSGPVMVPRTGLYHFGDVGINFNAGISLLAYENAFNPANTEQNLAGAVSFSGSLLLNAGTSYIFVAVDESDLAGAWQYALFPPGPVRWDASARGAWVTPGVNGAGILMEIGPDSGVLFFAWFTFPEAEAAPTSKDGNAMQALPFISPQADLGSADQRWLTGFGPISADSSVVSIRYENTTGGIFNATEPKPVTDSNYGTGTAEILNCMSINISYDLPGGLQGNAPMVRAIGDAIPDCLQAVNAAPIEP